MAFENSSATKTERTLALERERAIVVLKERNRAKERFSDFCGNEMRRKREEKRVYIEERRGEEGLRQFRLCPQNSPFFFSLLL